ncbi:peptidoglycan recognition family protein [Marinactinospora rubrisoli]|uniref:Peptidoglycan recognition family protein n=1 Tax=Marinactinospora rubrisoli TaxID=2715399 RepID=A0ABW2KGJ2_9ACTN
MPRPTRYVSRSDLGWGDSPAGYANPRSGLVIHYDGSNQGLAGQAHSACLSYWRATRNFHINTNGWVDIGYSFAACPHGYVMAGRGLFKVQAAQPGGNSTYYSCTLCGGPDDPVTDAQINAVRELRQWLMEPESSIAGTVRGHRDFISTSCPGDRAYAMVQDGTFARPPASGGTPPPDPESEDFLDMADLTWLSSSRTQRLPNGVPVCLLFQDGRDARITPDDPYATIAFQNRKFTGTLNGRVVAVGADGEPAPVAYRVQLGKVRGAVGADATPDPLFAGGVFTTTECNVSLDEITRADERLRIYVTALVDGAEWRGGKVTGWIAPL